MSSQLLLSKCEGDCRDTNLKSWTPTLTSLAKALNTPTIGEKDGPYYLRCAGTERNNTDTADFADIEIIDGDSRIDENGVIVSGAPAPEKVHQVLTRLGVTHLIYSSHSNGATREELEAKSIDSGGLYGADYHKYRVIIPCMFGDNYPVRSATTILTG